MRRFYTSAVGLVPGSIVGVVPVVPEVAVTGLKGKPAQYLTRAAEILRRVSGSKVLPVLAWAILSFCACGISLRQILFAIS